MRRAVIIFLGAIFVACGNNQKSVNDFDPYVWPDNEQDNEVVSSNRDMGSDDEVSVPFEIKAGVKFIPVKINGGPTFDMIFDTGCSETLISINEAQYLIQAGLLSQEDYKGNASFSIADGSIVENMVFNLKELIVGGKIRCSDVTVTVSNSIQAPMLLGNDVFDRMPSFTIDNNNQVIKFKLR